MPCRIARLVPTNHMGKGSGGGLAAWYAFQKKEEEEGEGLLALLCFALLAVLACLQLAGLKSVHFLVRIPRGEITAWTFPIW